MGSNSLPTAVGFLGTLVVFALLVWVVGVADILSALATARLAVIPFIFLAAVCWLVAWGLALKTVLRATDADISVGKSTFVITAAVFANNITPFGQAGGEPISALLIAEAADRDYEQGLAAIASVDTLHFIPTMAFAVLGLSLIVLETTTLGRNLLVAALIIIGLSLLLPLVAYLGWRYRYPIEDAVVRLLTPLIQWVARLVPGKREPAPDAISNRIDGFFEAIDRIAADRTTLVEALGFSALGWLAIAVSLWLSLYSLGVSAPFSAVLLVVPVAKMAGIAPLPGGSGAIETVTATLLVPTAGVSLSVALSAALIHRAGTYLLPTVVGAGVASALGANRHTTVE
jgi:uncharacterized protein (TIRG00374 family)